MKRFYLLAALFLVLAGCGKTDDPETAVAPIPPTPTIPQPVEEPDLQSTTESVSAPDRDYIVIATDAPMPNYAEFDKHGGVVGFNNDLMAQLAAQTDIEYEFVVTPYEGLLDLISTYDDFDAALANLVIPEQPQEGIVYTDPYLEIGQTLVVLADEDTLQSAQDIGAETIIGVQENSSGWETAVSQLAIPPANVRTYATPGSALQALVEENVNAVITDQFIAEHFVQSYPEQLKIAGTAVSSKSYGIALAADNVELLQQLNAAIAQAKEGAAIERLTVAWLLPDERIDAGESRVGTAANELIIGILGDLDEMEPAYPPDLISWEVKSNVMSGLYMFNSANQLVPILAAGDPEVSEDGLEFTINLRRGLRFPDGSDFTADDVVWSINRARGGAGGYLVNNYLKDADVDGYADTDSVQAIGPYIVKFVLQEPLAYFPSLLATPPYFPVSNECYAEIEDLTSICGGIGAYTIVSWEQGVRMHLKANPEWPGLPAPAFENIQLRFYDNVDDLRRSLVEFQSVDMAWTGLPYADYSALANQDVDGDGAIDFVGWTGPAAFKSYLIINQAIAPWDDERVRQAAAYAVDREALAADVFGNGRRPLFSPLPNEIPGYTTAFPARNLDQARTLLRQAGFTAETPLEITLHYLNDNRYSNLEEAYATALQTQLEETGIFKVTLENAAWDIYRGQISQCSYPFYLLGWPGPGQPVDYLEAPSWMDFFLRNLEETEACNNYSSYQSSAMAALAEAARKELDAEARLGIYREQQTLWAQDMPTIPLLQEPRRAVSLPKVDNVRIDAMGFLHYGLLTKN